jgi:hypothetical protein
MPITYLFIEFDECGFEQLVDVFSSVIWVLSVTQALAHLSLGWEEVSFNSSWERMERNGDILGVSDFFKLNV